MQKHSVFTPIHTILIPFVHEGPGAQVLEVARHLDAEIILVGVVIVPSEQSLRTYPNNPAARKAIRAQAKCKKAM